MQLLEPQPSEYGLEKESVTFFSSIPETWSFLPSILGWISFIGFYLLSPYSELIKKNISWWPIIILSFLPGMAAGWIINKLRDLYFENRKKTNRQYQKWQAYLNDLKEWQKIHYKELEAEKARKIQLRKQIEEEQRRQLKWWKSLNGKQFEKELSEFLKKLGYNVSLTPYSGDGGVDIFITEGTKRIIIQCKAHKKYISPGVVRELYGTIIHQQAEEGWIVTTSGFYSGSRLFALNKPIKLLTIKDILERKSINAQKPNQK